MKSFWQGDETITTWQPQEYYLGFPGFLNGGIIAKLINCRFTSTANAAAYNAEGRKYDTDPLSGYVTGSLIVKYLKLTPTDKPVTLKARFKEMKGRKIIVTCSLFYGETECATGEVVAIKIG